MSLDDCVSLRRPRAYHAGVAWLRCPAAGPPLTPMPQSSSVHLLSYSRAVALVLTCAVLAQAAPALPQTAAEGESGLWRARVDSLLADTTVRYAAILATLRPVRRDSALLAYMRDVARARGHAPGESFAINAQSVMRRRVSDYEGALALAEEAAALAATVADTLSQVVALNSQGVIYRRLDRIIDALDVHQRALELTRAVHEPDFGELQAQAIALNSKGQIHLTLDEFDDAAASFRASLAVDERNGNRLGLAINHGNLARIEEKRGRLDSALYYYRRAIVYNEEIGSALGLAICYTGLSQVYLKDGRLDEALDYARRAVPLAREWGDDTYIASAELQFGEALAATGSYLAAERRMGVARKIAEEKGLLDEEMRARFGLAELAERRDDPSAALAYYRRGHALERQIMSERNRRYVTAVNARYRADQRAAEIEALARENAEVRERNRRNNRLIGVTAAALVLLAVLFAVLYRQRRLVLQRDVARLEQQRMASQMNPHFLFNALNSIKAQLIKGEMRPAVVLLGQFASLMRRILNSSIDEEVSLAEELHSAKLYFDIENSRLSGEVDYQLEIDPAVALDDVKVPPLILQPFLENALLHGLRQKEGAKRLSVVVQAALEGGTEVRVRDNGIGRAAAAAIRERRAIGSHSVGIDITRQRLAYFARRQGRAAPELRIVDLTGADGAVAGTEVVAVF